ncbi:uncharacterized protein LOC118512831 isoform X2 [Anopheles stephensi]|uniref:uncharacterized protein LOC118512831 isoform X2 n=1 Tax=Anopheles stephensi TaxID=30069 RepID=UPI00165872D7|nr:uncharacterized protein LOC118512831 isoform X2 [Anopheles stephensi]
MAISIGRRNDGRRRPLVVLGLVLIVFIGVTVSAQEPSTAEVKVEKSASVDSSALLETALCAIRSNPGQCVRQQAARVLSNWEAILNAKKMEMLAEADKEVTARQQSRGLSDAEIARGKPSTLMEQIETGLGVLSEFVSEGVDEYVSDKEQGKEEEASSKTHLHHLLKLGNGAGGAGPGTGAPVGRADADDEDYRDQLAAVEDGLVDYAGLAGGPDKALGRGKRKGKKKKTFMKLFILGAALKAKIELLLKILSFKLQLKFFAVALIGLLINIARFWIDFKKQPSPQKVIYYEHAQHQHHYDDHGDGDFGGYWKRSLHNVHEEEPNYPGGHDRAERYDEPYPYRNPKYNPGTGNHYAPQLADPHAMAYQQQRPY